MTHYTGHIADHQHTTALLVINHKITVGHTHNHPTNVQGMESCRSDSYCSRTKRRPDPKKNMKVKIEDLHMDNYSSDDHSSDLAEESDHSN